MKEKRVNFNFFDVCWTNTAGVRQGIDFTEVFEDLRTKYQRIRANNDELMNMRRRITEIIGTQSNNMSPELSEEIVSIEEEILRLENSDLLKNVYEYSGEPVRLSNITLDVDSGFYHLCFERFYNYDLPIITTLHGESEEIEVEVDEYIGHQVSILYDPQCSTLMIQRNRDSLSPTAIEQFLLKLYEEDNEVSSTLQNNFRLTAHLDESASAKALAKNIYKRFDVEVIGDSADDLLTRLFSSDRSFEGVESIEIVIKGNRTRNDTIQRESVRELLQEYIENDDVKKLSVRGKNEDDLRIEPIDLIAQKLQVTIPFLIEESRHLNPVSVFEAMLTKYLEERGVREILMRRG